MTSPGDDVVDLKLTNMSDPKPGMKKLPTAAVRLISSSQVITSILSVVKELIENSLDAGAKSVEIKLDNFGFDKIEVRDNGIGIKPEDREFMAQPHYTSKITSTADLDTLQSYGFRGEALGSLCAVSDVSITTKTMTDEVSFTYSLNQKGLITATKPSHLGQGTTVVAVHIFKYLPVRKQYYSTARKRKEELKKVEDIVISYSLIRPDIRFLLRHNKDTIWQKNPVASPRDAMIQVFGPVVLSGMQHMRRLDDENEIDIELYVPKPSGPPHMNSKSTNDRTFIFVNKRPVILKNIEKVLKTYYNHATKCETNRFPLAFISILLPPQGIDVNVDPNKTKVMIHEKVELHNFLESLLKEIYGPLESDDKDMPEKSKQINREQVSDELTDLSIESTKEFVNSNENGKQLRQSDENPQNNYHPETPELKITLIGDDVKQQDLIGRTVECEVQSKSHSHVNIEDRLNENPTASTFADNQIVLSTQSANFSLFAEDELLMTSTPMITEETGDKIASNSFTARSQSAGKGGSLRSETVSDNTVTIHSEGSKAQKDTVSFPDEHNLKDDSLETFTFIDIDTPTKVSENTVSESNGFKNSVTATWPNLPNIEEYNVENRDSSECQTSVSHQGKSKLADDRSEPTSSTGVSWSKGLAIQDTRGENVEPVKLLMPSITSFLSPGSVVRSVPMATSSHNSSVNTSLDDDPKQKLITEIPGQATLYDIIGSNPVKRPTSAYIYYSKEIRSKVVDENPGAKFEEISKIIGERWKDLSAEERQRYEDMMAKDTQRYKEQLMSTSSNTPLGLKAGKRRKIEKSSSSKKPSTTVNVPRKCVQVNFSVTKLKKLYKTGFKPSQYSETDSKKFAMIGQIKSCGAWFGLRSNNIMMFQPIRAQEMLIYTRLLEKHSLPTKKLDTPIALSESCFKQDDLFEVVKELSQSTGMGADIYRYVIDPRITRNGFTIRTTTDMSSDEDKFELYGMSDCMNFFGLNDLEEILSSLKVNMDITVTECRPSKVKHYLQSEAVRMARQLPQRLGREETLDVLDQLIQTLGADTTHCFHNKPIFKPMYDMAGVPDRQDSSQ